MVGALSQKPRSEADNELGERLWISVLPVLVAYSVIAGPISCWAEPTTGTGSTIGLGCLVEADLDPNGQYLATCSESALHLWHLNGTLVSMMPAAPGAPFTGLAWSPHGSMIALSDYLGHMIVVRAPDLSIVATMRGEYGRFSGVGGMLEVHPWPVEWSPNGTSTALGWCDERCYLYGVSDRALQAWAGKDDSWEETEDLDWSPIGEQIALGTHEVVSVFDISNTSKLSWDEQRRLAYTNVSLFQITGHQPAFSPNGTYLAVLTEQGFSIHDGRSGSLVLSAQLPFSVETLAWSPTGDLLALGGLNGRILIVDPSNGEVMAETGAHSSSVKSLCWEGTHMASASRDGTVKTWSVDPSTTRTDLVRTFSGWETGVRTALWYPDGQRIAAAHNRGGSVKVYGPGGSEELRIDFGEEEGELLGAAVSRDGRMIAALTEEGGVSIWDAQYGSMATLHDIPNVYALLWNPVHTSMFALVGQGGIGVLDALDPGRGVFSSVEVDGHAMCADWSPDGSMLVVGLLSGVQIWDPFRPALVASTPTWRYPYAVAWSPDGTKLACLAGPDWRFDLGTVPAQYKGISEIARVDVWELQRALAQWGLGLLASSYIPRTGDVSLSWSLSWAPNSTMLCGGVSPSSFDPRSLESRGLASIPCVMVWRLEPGAGSEPGPGTLGVGAVLKGPARWVTSVSWSLDGTKIAAGSNDGSIWVWQVGCEVGKGSDMVLAWVVLLLAWVSTSWWPTFQGPRMRGRLAIQAS